MIKLDQFIQIYDSPNTVILLEGKRNVKEEDKPKLVELGKLLCLHSDKMIFRSGNAAGADDYFIAGVASVDPSRIEIITPYENHRRKASEGFKTVSLDEIDLAEEPELVYGSKTGKADKLIDAFARGEKNRNTIKAAYLIRDTVKVLGTNTLKPARFAFFYDDLDNPKQGGTGHTMKVCEKNEIAYFDQSDWFEWV